MTIAEDEITSTSEEAIKQAVIPLESRISGLEAKVDLIFWDGFTKGGVICGVAGILIGMALLSIFGG